MGEAPDALIELSHIYDGGYPKLGETRILLPITYCVEGNIVSSRAQNSIISGKHVRNKYYCT
eukprot:scaffold4486_cov337-Alexandrium_tamarense.AAC.2